jgi:hypothetical protein
MQQLVYVSTASVDFNKEELLALLNTCRINNNKLNVTGMLLFKDSNFIQVLEGEDSVAQALFDKIAADHRHRSIIKLLTTKIDQRDFPDWSMAFKNLNDVNVSNYPGYSEFLNLSFTDASFATDTSKAQRLLQVFRTNMR